MTTIDTTRRVFRVNGRIADGRRQTIFLNAESEIEAKALAAADPTAGFVEITLAHEIDPKTGWKKT